MSTHESQRQSSQGKPETRKQGNAHPSPGKHSEDSRTPLPFDDDDASGAGDMVQTSPPQGPNIDPEF